MTPRSVASAVLGAAFLWAPGCASSPESGYAMKSPYRTDIRTVEVPIFRNDTFEPYLEEALTDAIIKEIHRVTPWRVTSDDGAQTVLTGAITDVQMRKLSTQDESGLTQELAVEIAVSFEWKRRSDATVLVARRNFRAADPFVPGNPVGEGREIGRRGAVDELARAIVAELRSSW